MFLIKEHWVPLFVGGVGFILLILGIVQIFTRSENKENLVFEEAESKEIQSNIKIDIEGAVIKPGIYEIKGDSRVVDALAAAGGLSEEADRSWVEKNINLAQKVNDGIKIYIPRIGESISQESGSSVGSTININTAGVKDLESLPGIGEVTAQKIIDNRPYSSVEDLISKKVVGNTTFEKIKNLVSAN